MTPFALRSCPRASEMAKLDNAELRRAFLIEKVMGDGIDWTFTDLDRMAVAGVRPAGGGAVTLENHRETGAEFFLARRELGVINTGGRGTVRVDGKAYDMANLDGLYVGMGARSVTFESAAADGPAKFFLLSCPAHQTFPTTQVKKDQANPVRLGAQATANQRTIYQYIHPGGIRSAQLVMGFTELAEGSVWNTMPPHTHSRRTEIYYYFDVQQNHVVSHFMGPPDNTRNLWVNNEQAVLSPAWSIHSGCGTAAYKFIWAMGGENQVFNDMDMIAPPQLR